MVHNPLMAFDSDASADLDLESPWEDVTAFAHDQRSRENEWTKLSSDFTNVRSPNFCSAELHSLL